MKIVQKEILTDIDGTRIVKIKIHSPLISNKAAPGQFVALMVTESGERIPLTIVESDPHGETITLIVQEIGYSTKLLGKMKVGASLHALAGPLGHPTEIKKYVITAVNPS